MKNLKSYEKPEIQLVEMIDVIMASGFGGGGDEGDGGYAPDDF
jgi:hypothetical protein